MKRVRYWEYRFASFCELETYFSFKILTKITIAYPDTIADIRKRKGINAVFHRGFPGTTAKINPVYPWTEIARGIPINPKILAIL